MHVFALWEKAGVPRENLHVEGDSNRVNTKSKSLFWTQDLLAVMSQYYTRLKHTM